MSVWHADWTRLLHTVRRSSSASSATFTVAAALAPRLMRMIDLTQFHAHHDTSAAAAAAAADALLPLPVDANGDEYAPPPTLVVFSPMHASHVWCAAGGGGQGSGVGISGGALVERALVCVDIETGRACAEVPLRHAPRALAISPDGCALAVGGGARCIVMVDAHTGDAEEFYGAADAVRCVAFAASGAALVCGAANEVHIFSG